MREAEDRIPTINCEFFGADPDLVASVSCGLIDQICAHVDVEAALLAAIEVPVLDVVEALSRRGPVTAVAVTVDPDRTLVVEFQAAGLDDLGDPTVADVLGGTAELVTSFFDVDIHRDSGRIRLRGDLE